MQRGIVDCNAVRPYVPFYLTFSFSVFQSPVKLPASDNHNQVIFSSVISGSVVNSKYCVKIIFSIFLVYLVVS